MESMGAAIRAAERNWGWMLAYGVLLILLGIFAAMHPVATGLAVGIILAISFIVAGILALIAAFRDGGWQAKTVDIVFGILAVLAGVICIVNPFNGATSVIWAIGIMFLVMGAYEFVSGLRATSEKTWLILMGIVDMVIGFWAAFMLGPMAALFSLAVLVGISFIFRGVMLSSLAWQLRGRAKA